MVLSSPRKHCVGPSMVAFRGVIEDHVENDLDSGPVQRFDHVAKFVHRAQRILTRAIRLVRRKERNRRIAPVVDSSRRAILSIELKDRQQFDRGDAELLKIRNLLDQTGVCAAFRFGDAGTGMRGKAAHVHLVDDRARGGPLQRRVAFPVVGAADPPPRSSSPSRRCRPRGGCVAAVVLRNHDGAAVRVEQELGRIEAEAARGIEWSVNPKAIYLAGLDAGYEDVPVVVRSVRFRIDGDHARRTAIVLPIEEQQLHSGSAAGVDTEVDAPRNQSGTQREARSGGVKVFAGVALSVSKTFCWMMLITQPRLAVPWQSKPRGPGGSLWHRTWLQFPDVGCVFGDGAVTREFSGACHIQDGLLCPSHPGRHKVP